MKYITLLHKEILLHNYLLVSLHRKLKKTKIQIKIFLLTINVLYPW